MSHLDDLNGTPRVLLDEEGDLWLLDPDGAGRYGYLSLDNEVCDYDHTLEALQSGIGVTPLADAIAGPGEGQGEESPLSIGSEDEYNAITVTYLDGDRETFSTEDAEGIQVNHETGTLVVRYPDGVSLVVPGTAIRRVDVSPVEG